MAVVKRLLAFGTAALASLPSSMTGRTIAHGWATVDSDRAVDELGQALGLSPDRFVIAPDTRLLGARCRVARDVLPDGSSLAVLEPATEGRLAATLARVGEGPAAVWLMAAGARGPGTASVDKDDPLSSEYRGPFGLERLVLGGATHGPHRLLVAPTGTIRPWCVLQVGSDQRVKDPSG